MVLQQIAGGVLVDDMQVVSFHPGAIFTWAVRDAGYTETTMKWDDGKCYLQLHIKPAYRLVTSLISFLRRGPRWTLCSMGRI
jgi:hypothetical protein